MNSEDMRQVLVSGLAYFTQKDLWQNNIFQMGDEVISLIPDDNNKKGLIKEINRRMPEKFTPFDDLIVEWEDGKRDYLYFNQITNIGNELQKS